MKWKPIVGGVLLIVTLLLIAALLGAWKLAEIRDAAAKPALVPPDFVEVATVGTESWQPTARLVGTVFAKRSVIVANEVVGVVSEVGFTSGDTVEPGQVLVKLDDSTEQADLAAAQAAEHLASATIEIARADIRVAESSRTLAENNHKRAHSANQGAVAAMELDRLDAELEKTAADLDRQRSTLISAEAALEQAKARTRQVQTTIAKKTLSAPFRARAGMRTVHPGQYLAEGTSIVELTELTDDIYIDFAVPQEYAARVIPGAVVVARSKMLGGESIPITVISIDATVNPTTRNVRVRSSVPNPDHAIKPGMFIDVEVPVEPAKEQVVIPATAVRRAAFGDHVFTLVPGDPKNDPPHSLRAQQRMVVLGPDLGGRVIVTSGLKAGEQVAADGSFKLRDGSLVIPGPPPAPAGEDKGPTPTADPNH